MSGGSKRTFNDLTLTANIKSTNEPTAGKMACRWGFIVGRINSTSSGNVNPDDVVTRVFGIFASSNISLDMESVKFNNKKWSMFELSLTISIGKQSNKVFSRHKKTITIKFISQRNPLKMSQATNWKHTKNRNFIHQKYGKYCHYQRKSDLKSDNLFSGTTKVINIDNYIGWNKQFAAMVRH